MKNCKIGIKATAVILAMTLAVSIFTGCGKKGNDKDEHGRTKVSVGNWPQKSGVDLDNYEKQKEMFEKQNTDAVIIPDSWQFDLKTFYAKAAGGQLPTLYLTHYTEIPQIIESGYSADLTDALKKRGYEGKFSDAVLKQISKDGRIYAFPTYAYTFGLGYNTDMFEKAGLMESDGTPKQPKDWNEVAEFAQRIKKATGKPGFAIATANNNGGWVFTCLAWSFGAKFMEQEQDGKWKATFNTPETAAALQYVKDLKWKYDVLPSNTLIDGAEYRKTFAVGEAGMIIAPGGISDSVPQYGMKPEQLGLMPLPAGPVRRVTLLGGRIMAVAPNATDDQIDAAIRWLEMQYNYKVTDEFKTSQENDIKARLSKNEMIGTKGLSIWKSDTESAKFINDLIDKNANANINHVRLYNESVLGNEVEVQAEEPVCTQELYGILDSCIQEVLVNENADCAALLEKANSDFQHNYLDTLDY